jgi:hypothetical protein
MMFSISHWGMFDVPWWSLESYRNFLWYSNAHYQI